MAILPDDIGRKLNEKTASQKKELVSSKQTSPIRVNSATYSNKKKTSRHQHLAFFSLAGVLGC